MCKRVMIKLSGEALAGGKPNSYNRELIEGLAEEIKLIVNEGVSAAIVTGAGNFWRGARSDSRVDRVTSDHMGMMATAMNALYITDCFNKTGLKAITLSSVQIGAVFEMYSKQKAVSELECGNTVVFAYGTGHPYFSTDTSAALYGSEINADLIISLKSGVDGVYTKDPAEFPEEAVFIEKITYDEVIRNADINVMDKSAACICRESGIKTVIISFEKGNILKAVKGDKIGTLCYQP